MHPDDIYELSAAGQGELRGGATTLTPAEIALLVRFDGALTVQQVQDGLSPAGRKTFAATFRSLRERRLLALVELDPFASRFHADMGALSALIGDSEADAGLASLQRSGFYVQIARERADVRPLPPGQAPTVLVVEDDQALASFIESYLKLSGLKVRLAADRAGVLAGLRAQPLPDLVLLDVMLPDADGFDILLRMRQHPALKHMPVIMLTGKATRQAVIKGMAAGADGYLTKPLDPESVMRAVRTVLRLEDDRPGLDSVNDPWVNADGRQRRTSWLRT